MTSLEELEMRVRRLEESLFYVSHSPPSKVPVPMVRIADGTDWNPGGGAGMYLSMDGGQTWSKL